MMWRWLASLALLLAGYLPTNRGMMSRVDAATSGVTYYFQTGWRRVRHQRPDAAAKASCGELGGIRRLWPSVSALRFLL